MPREGLNVNHLEEILLQELRRFEKELWKSVLASLEETILTEREGESPSPSADPFGLDSFSEVSDNQGGGWGEGLPLPSR